MAGGKKQGAIDNPIPGSSWAVVGRKRRLACRSQQWKTSSYPDSFMLLESGSRISGLAHGWPSNHQEYMIHRFQEGKFSRKHSAASRTKDVFVSSPVHFSLPQHQLAHTMTLLARTRTWTSLGFSTQCKGTQSWKGPTLPPRKTDFGYLCHRFGLMVLGSGLTATNIWVEMMAIAAELQALALPSRPY